MSLLPRIGCLARALLVSVGILAAGGAGWTVRPAWAQDEAFQTETRVKAAFLYKFIGYIDWPVSSFQRPDSPVVIGVIGADALAAELTQAVAGRTVNDRPVSVR